MSVNNLPHEAGCADLRRVRGDWHNAMNDFPKPLDLKRVKVYPLAQRHSLSPIETLLVDPAQPAAPCSAAQLQAIHAAARQITAAANKMPL